MRSVNLRSISGNWSRRSEFYLLNIQCRLVRLIVAAVVVSSILFRRTHAFSSSNKTTTANTENQRIFNDDAVDRTRVFLNLLLDRFRGSSEA